MSFTIYETYETDPNGVTERQVIAADGGCVTYTNRVSIINGPLEGDKWHRTREAAVARAIEIQRAHLIELTGKAAAVAVLLDKLLTEQEALTVCGCGI